MTGFHPHAGWNNERKGFRCVCVCVGGAPSSYSTYETFDWCSHFGVPWPSSIVFHFSLDIHSCEQSLCGHMVSPVRDAEPCRWRCTEQTGSSGCSTPGRSPHLKHIQVSTHNCESSLNVQHIWAANEPLRLQTFALFEEWNQLQLTISTENLFCRHQIGSAGRQQRHLSFFSITKRPVHRRGMKTRN